MQLSPAILERLAAVGVSVVDVDERFVRGAGPGGQKMNKASSIVWLRQIVASISVFVPRKAVWKRRTWRAIWTSVRKNTRNEPEAGLPDVWMDV
jgi:protein subunit release factor B